MIKTYRWSSNQIPFRITNGGIVVSIHANKFIEFYAYTYQTLFVQIFLGTTTCFCSHLCLLEFRSNRQRRFKMNLLRHAPRVKFRLKYRIITFIGCKIVFVTRRDIMERTIYVL